jgi:hypothetical protein
LKDERGELVDFANWQPTRDFPNAPIKIWKRLKTQEQGYIFRKLQRKRSTFAIGVLMHIDEICATNSAKRVQKSRAPGPIRHEVQPYSGLHVTQKRIPSLFVKGLSGDPII